jgi:hypothetical protein
MDVDENNSLGSITSLPGSVFGVPGVPRLKADVVYAKSDELTAVFHAHLPIEVKQVLKNAGMTGDV